MDKRVIEGGVWKSIDRVKLATNGDEVGKVLKVETADAMSNLRRQMLLGDEDSQVV